MAELTRRIKREEARQSGETQQVPFGESCRDEEKEKKTKSGPKKNHPWIFRDSPPAHLLPFCHVIVISLPESRKTQGHLHYLQHDR